MFASAVVPILRYQTRMGTASKLTGRNMSIMVQSGSPAGPSFGAIQENVPRRQGSQLSFSRIRLAQIRAASAIIGGLTRVGRLASLFASVRKWPLVRQCVNLAAGY